MGGESSAADWVGAWGQVGGALATSSAVIVALVVALGDRRQRRQEAAEAEKLQARLITVELRPGGPDGVASVRMTNNSSRPIFQPTFEVLTWWLPEGHGGADVGPSAGSAVAGAAPGSGDDASFDAPFDPTPCEVLHPQSTWADVWPLVPPDDHVPYRWRAVFVFTDANGRRWRRTNHDEPVRI